ncbi:MAG: hypothetical protein H6587_05880 [Flavobacteriales bacterium]|nr:hypothetical protein [Flavobacteriales bacterium]MCB9364080.1 hypothetical protein [Flavobacteriales bacterium]
MRIVFICLSFLFLIGCSSDQKQKITDTSVSGTDTLVFYSESVEESNPFQQLLKVVNTSDSTVWFALKFVNSTGNNSLIGEGIDLYYNLDPEIDEINGEAQPVLEYETTGENKGLFIRVDMMNQNFAKVLASPDYLSQEEPLDVVMIKR